MKHGLDKEGRVDLMAEWPNLTRPELLENTAPVDGQRIHFGRDPAERFSRASSGAHFGAVCWIA